MGRYPRRLARVGASVDLPDSAAFDTYLGPSGELVWDASRRYLVIHDGMTIGGNLISDSRIPAVPSFAALSSLFVKADRARTVAYAAGGDGGGARYRRVDDEPPHELKAPCARGGWWEIDEPIIYATMAGALGDGATDDRAAVQRALDINRTSLKSATVALDFGRTFALDGAIRPNSRTKLVCDGWIKMIGRGAPNSEVAIIPPNGGSDITLVEPKVDCNFIPSVSGFMARTGNSNFRVTGGVVKNARHEPVGTGEARGGGNGFNVESNVTVLPSVNILIDGLTIINCTHGFTFVAGEGIAKQNVQITNIRVQDCDVVYWIVGNTTGYPHDPEEFSGSISNVSAYNCGKPNIYTNGGGAFCSDRACNIEQRNIVLMNSAAYGPIPSVWHGNGANIHLDLTFFGDCTSILNFQPYKANNSPPTTEFTMERSRFDVKHSGVATDIAVVGSATDGLVNDVLITAFVENVSSGTPVSVNMRAMTDVFFDVYDAASNGQVKGRADKIGARPFTDAGGGLFLAMRVAVGGDGRSTYAGALLVNGGAVAGYEGGLEVAGLSPAIALSDLSSSAWDYGIKADANLLTFAVNSSGVQGAWTEFLSMNNQTLYPVTSGSVALGTLTQRFGSVHSNVLSLAAAAAAPSATAGAVSIYCDGSDESVKARFPSGIIKTLTNG